MPSVPDHLDLWCRMRDQVPWTDVQDPRPGAAGQVVGIRDGMAHFIRTDVHDRSPERALRLLAALTALRSDVSAGRALDFSTMRRWQGHVLGTERTDFRTGPAFAKGGRESYGLDADTRRRFDACLQQADDPAVPLPARAARAHLDVCFFHPFDDGNARAALLALTFVLARGGVVLDQVGPIQISRGATGALEFARLVAVLIRTTQNRAVHAAGTATSRLDHREDHLAPATGERPDAPPPGEPLHDEQATSGLAGQVELRDVRQVARGVLNLQPQRPALGQDQA
ncbi:Fic family protein [Spirillospora sp. NBC_01491]|nr:Fic family protein [Spirillospora sp. NBC_01491]